MGLILSLDPAINRIKDFGCVLIEAAGGRAVRVTFPTPDEIGIRFPPDPNQCAGAIAQFCREREVSVVLIDGPQGWKDPGSRLEYRLAESILATPGKTGTFGNVKPKNFERFVEFTTALFGELVKRGAVLPLSDEIEMRQGTVLVAESFPTSAFKKLNLKPLAAAKRASQADLERALQSLIRLYGFQVCGRPSHHELSALASGLAGVAILAGRRDGYIAEGARPREVDGHWVEGFIVNPRLPLSSTPITVSPMTRSPDHPISC